MTQACITCQTHPPSNLWTRLRLWWGRPRPKKPQKLDVARLHPRLQRDIGLTDAHATRASLPQRPGPYC